MSVFARKFVATPERTAATTWGEITALVCGSDQVAKQEFIKIEGLAACSISEETLRDDALVIAGVGPRLRVYCLYGEDAITGDRKNEEPLSWKPTDGDWKGYLPCTSEDFDWMTKAIKERSSRFTAYDVAQGLPKEVSESQDEQSQSQGEAKSTATIDAERFRNL